VHGHLQSHKMTWSVYKALYLSGDPSRPGLQLSSAEMTSGSPFEEDEDDIMLDLPLQVNVVFYFYFFLRLSYPLIC
jgi:hypothetical protein